MARLNARRTAVDEALFKPEDATGEFKGKPMSELMKIRADIERGLVAAESKWLKASETLEQADVL